MSTVFLLLFGHVDILNEIWWKIKNYQIIKNTMPYKIGHAMLVRLFTSMTKASKCHSRISNLKQRNHLRSITA